jgi:curved DNA-binding protein CbpA
MAETFYSALGVSADADRETIRSAYRDQVKRHHPDVSDAPDASERFRRLTTARDVLLDDEERARYDRVGHAAYVERHVESTAWTADQPRPGTGSGAARAASGQNSRRDGTARRRRRAAWLGDEASGHAGRGGDGGRQQRRGHAGSTTRASDSGAWQHASGVYRRTETDYRADRSRVASVVRGVRTVGPWLPVHLVLILSAVATGWFTYTQASRAVGPSVPAMVFGLVLVGLVVVLSVLHAFSRVVAL